VISDERRPLSLTTPGHTSTVELKIDSTQPGNQRKEFVGALQSEMKTVSRSVVANKPNRELAAAATIVGATVADGKRSLAKEATIDDVKQSLEGMGFL
jgi:hypothetical protein